MQKKRGLTSTSQKKRWSLILNTDNRTSSDGSSESDHLRPSLVHFRVFFSALKHWSLSMFRRFLWDETRVKPVYCKLFYVFNCHSSFQAASIYRKCKSLTHTCGLYLLTCDFFILFMVIALDALLNVCWMWTFSSLQISIKYLNKYRLLLLSSCWGWGLNLFSSFSLWS